MKTFRVMLKNELKLSLRGMDMLIFAIIIPVVILIILGVIYGGKPDADGAEATWLQQAFGALSTIAICAGGVMGLPLVVSDYRSRGILKRFKTTPISPAVILAVEVAIYAIYSLASLFLIYVVSAIFFDFRMSGSWAGFFCGYFLVMLSMFSIGMMVGGISPNAKIAGVIASILYFPMLIFSGATLPYEVMPPAMQKAADILPLTQGIKLLKAATLGTSADNVLLPIFAMAVIVVICVTVSIRFFKWE